MGVGYSSYGRLLSIRRVHKMLNSRPTLQMFVQIGMRKRVAGHAAKTLPAVELLLAVAIVTSPSLWPTVVLTSIAGLTIITVGVLALRRPYDIQCVCFSSDNGGNLGCDRLGLVSRFWF